MKKLFALLCLFLVFPALAQTPAQKTRSQLQSEIGTNLPDQTTGAITPAIMRQTLLDMLWSWWVINGTAPGNADYAMTASDRYVYTTALNAPHTWTLPSASSLNKGEFIVVIDAAGVVTGVNTLSIVRSGTDTINGGASPVIFSTPAAWVMFFTDGVSNWGRTAPGAGGGGTGNLVLSTSTITGPGQASGSFLYDTSGLVGERSPVQTAAALPAFSTTTTTQGLVVGSNNLGTNYFLRADGTWQIPPAGGGGVTVYAPTAPMGGNITGNTLTVSIGLDSNFVNNGSNQLALANIAAGNVLGNSTAASAEPTGTTLTAMFDRAFGSISAAFLQRGASAWVANTMLGDGTLSNTGALTVTKINGLAYPNTIAANTVLGATTAGTVAALAVGSCSTSNSGLQWTTGTGFGCNSNLANLTVASQTVSGGANWTTLVQSGSFTADCGLRPAMSVTNTGAFTITAPANDGSCIILVTNGAGAAIPSFAGFSVGTNVGDAWTTTSGNKFSVHVWRVGGTAGYRIAAHQ